MDLNRFTEKAQEAVLAARSLATRAGQQQIEPEHLLLALLEQDAGIDQLHACGGRARCTTCRVEFIEGEPPRMTKAEIAALAAKGATGVRLSCQILCDHDMTVRAISRLAGSGRADAGPTPQPFIEPPPEYSE